MLERGALGSFRRPRSAEGWRGWRSLCWADMRMVIWQLSSHGAWVKRTGPSVISFHHCSLLPADLQTWVICLWPSVCLCVSASHSAYNRTGSPWPPQPTRTETTLAFSVSRRFILVLSPSSLQPSSSSLVSHGFRLCVSACACPMVEGARARVKSSEGDTLCLVPR